MLKPGQSYFVGFGDSGRIGTYKIEVESPNGHGKFDITGIGTNKLVIPHTCNKIQCRE